MQIILLVRDLFFVCAMEFLKFLFHSVGNIIILLLSFLFIGAGIMPLGYEGNLDAIAPVQAVMIGIGVFLFIFLRHRACARRNPLIVYQGSKKGVPNSEGSNSIKLTVKMSFSELSLHRARGGG